MLPSLILPLLLVFAPTCSALNRADLQDTIRTIRQYIIFSHLSPLITYSPADAWNITAERAYTTTPGAHASFDWMGNNLYVTGGQMHAQAEQSPPLDLVPESARSGSASRYSGQDGLRNTSHPNHNLSPLMSMYSVDVSLFMAFERKTRTLSLSLPQDVEGKSDDPNAPDSERGVHLNVTHVQLATELPRSNDEEDGGEFYHGFDVEAAVTGDNSSSSALEHGGEWSVAQGYDLTDLSLPSGYMQWRNASNTWNTTSVLHTDATGAGLRWRVPRGSSFIQVYGSVGPEQGRFELRLLNTTEIRIELDLHGDVIEGTTERPVERSSELLANAYLDPSTEYDAEMVLVEEGKRLDVNGFMAYQYYRNPEEIDTNWLQQYNDWVNSAGGLSGGQIAGIVAGSVAGAAILAGALWYFCRRRKRTQAASAVDDAATLRESPTLNNKEPV